MSVLNLLRIGNSVGVILPKELFDQTRHRQGRYDLRRRSAGWSPPHHDGSGLRGAIGRGAPRHAATQDRAARTGEVTVWLSRQLVLAIHDEQLAEHGGALGVRDAGLLDSALARPLNRAGYGQPDTAELAALYAIAIALNHPFLDGNKRTAYVTLETFLALNGCRFAASDADAVVMTLAMAAGEVDGEGFTDRGAPPTSCQPDNPTARRNCQVGHSPPPLLVPLVVFRRPVNESLQTLSYSAEISPLPV